MNFLSPLRYPGGKYKLAQFFAFLIEKNDLSGSTYIEPYAGGASVGLFLLTKGYVNKIIINDLNPLIYNFWWSILNKTDWFIEKIIQTPITIDEWYNQKEIVSNYSAYDAQISGFATFYLNRTNRSGIINGGVIGGKAQKGKYKINARFNKTNLIERIRNINQHNHKIILHNKDAVALINEITLSPKTILYLDPPYYNKANGLYQNFYTHEDHAIIAKIINKLKTPWVLTYDDVEQIHELYKGNKSCKFNITYSVANKIKKANEVLYYSMLDLPDYTFM